MKGSRLGVRRRRRGKEKPAKSSTWRAFHLSVIALWRESGDRYLRSKLRGYYASILGGYYSTPVPTGDGRSLYRAWLKDGKSPSRPPPTEAEPGSSRRGSFPMPHERSIWETAIYLVSKHGDAAPSVARREADRHADREDEAGLELWLRVMEAASELVRRPGKAREIH